MRTTVPGPFGPITLTEAGGRIVRVAWGAAAADGPPSAVLAETARQLGAYFAGTRTAFDLPLAPGTGLAGDVRRALTAIPFGQTRTYGGLARSLGVTPQAIGRACAANPLPILVPCHRVLAADGLGGYSAPGGIETKVALLRHEGAASLLF